MKHPAWTAPSSPSTCNTPVHDKEQPLWSSARLMGFLRTYILPVLLLVCGTNASNREVRFKAIDALANKVCPVERRLVEFENTSRLSCMTKAALRNDSAGVGYQEYRRMCFICDTYLEITGPFLASAGTIFYQRLGVLPYGVTKVDIHKLLIVKEPSLSYDKAHKACATYGALVKINTEAKQNAIRSFLNKSSNGLSEYSFWIQLHRQADEMEWKFDGGTVAPKTAHYWYPAQPDMEEWSPACGRLYKYFGFMWDDTECDYRMGFVCELH